jgi:hypothetical protein
LELDDAALGGFRNYQSTERRGFRDFMENLNVPKSARGFSFRLESTAKTGRARYLSTQNDLTAQRFREMQFRETVSGIWEAPIPLDESEESDNAILSMFWALGFGVMI